MRLARFFIDRPVFAAVLSIAITLIGGLAATRLPIGEFPEIAPPTVQVTAFYPGASAETIASTVAGPIEQEINGVDGMLYLSSQSTGDGRVAISVVFRQGVNVDQAQVLVQNRVAIAQPRLPEDVRRLGVTVRKASPDFLMVVHMLSPDGSRSPEYVSNYATLTIKDRLARLEGVGDAQVFGARDYAMRVWLDPDRVAARGLSAGDVVAALQRANVQVAAGAIGQAPRADGAGAFEVSVRAQGRLSSPEEFDAQVIGIGAGGAPIRLSDVARTEIGANDYTINAMLDNRVAVGIGVFQRPGSNALATAAAIRATMEEAQRAFPAGIAYEIVYDPTRFIADSMEAVLVTFVEAVVLVVLVVVLFLQNWRAAVIPLLAIPVSIIGTFAVLLMLGFTLNSLTMFGLILAIGIVVDDAIVVVENAERHMALGLSPLEAARKTMDEVGFALIAIALVLVAVFIPTTFINGIAGAFYRQFAVTISVATVLSAIVSLTLSPALAALLLKPHGHSQAEPAVPADHAVLPRLQLVLRQALLRLWRADAKAGAAAVDPDDPVCRPAGRDRLAGHGDPHRPGSAAGPRLHHRRLPAAARLQPEPDRRGDSPRLGDDRRHAGRRQFDRLRRPRWRDLHQRAQHRRGLCRAAVVRGARTARRHRQLHPSRSAGPPDG
jgi:HAE1 family hydrophobic/amphiphilic exporter-1